MLADSTAELTQTDPCRASRQAHCEVDNATKVLVAE